MRPVRAAERNTLTAPDGSSVREIVGPPTGTAQNQSLAEATVPSGGETTEHYHRASEEIYVFTAGRGWMKLADEEFEVGPGDHVAIPPGTPHKLRNPGPEALVLLCCCSPPYSDDDTVFVGS